MRPSPTSSSLLGAVVGSAALVLAGAPEAHATPKPLPFSYFANVQPVGAFEIETYTDVSPVRVARVTDAGSDTVTALGFGLQTELEVGLCEGLELGWYFAFKQDAAADGTAFELDGIKQRLRWQLAPADAWPIDVALYGELAELHDELEIEEKLILSKRVGAWRFAVNVVFEQEYGYADEAWELVYNPSVGVVYDLSPSVSLGLEYWAHGTIEDEDEGEGAEGEESEGAVHYLGPTLYAATKGPWFSLGAYVRMDSLGDKPTVGDPYGKLWVRAIVGFDL
ncbi:MAG: hypothetical protein U1F43_33470 [Myxococcota bacterium]